MRFQIGPSLLAVAMVGAAGLAFFQRSHAAESTPGPRATASEPAPPLGADLSATTLPPNHPPITPKGGDPSSFARDDSPPALTWSAPAGWEVTPNASPIRLVTYRIPAPKGTTASAELTVTRAGGTTAANVERWVGQFDSAGPDSRAERTIDGFHVATVEVSGTYEGGMTKGGPDTAHPGWSLLGAVVETGGPSYFFKMVGPAETVHAARPAFVSLLKSLHKAS
jgi:hypothetical protein